MGINQRIIKKLNVQAAESFIEEVVDVGTYYIFAAKHTPFGNTGGVIDFGGGTDDNPPIPQDSSRGSIQVYDDMVFGKRVKSSDVIIMIKKYLWTENAVFDMYSDTDSTLMDKPFYTVTDDGVEYKVYKCLFNNNGAPSTQKPFGEYLEPIEFPQDGYIWKYMFTIDQLAIRKFATVDYVPVVPNPDVKAAAVEGSIEIIKINNSGAGYTNYTKGRFPSPDNISIDGDILKFGLDASASSVDTFYNNCLIKITSGGGSGQFRLIKNYSITGGKKVIELDSPFITLPSAQDEYEIYPNVFVYDVNGTATANCVARAIISANTGNSISKIEVLSPGAGYRLATASLKMPGVVVPLANASVSPILSPPGGHGFDVDNELYAHYVGMTASFIGDEVPLSANNDYRTVGILRNPLYSNVIIRLDTSSTKGSFLKGETIFRYKPVKVSGNVATLAANTTILGDNTSFLDSFRTNDRVIITNGVTNITANVETIIGDSELKIDRQPTFTDANCSIYIIDAEEFGKVVDFTPYELSLTNVKPVRGTISSFMLGNTSCATTQVSNVQPYATTNGRDVDEFNAYNQLTAFVGSFSSADPLFEDETIVQDLGAEINPTAIVHSFTDNTGSSSDYLYTSNILGDFLTVADGGDGRLRGEISKAYFTALYKYNGEIIPDSGEILYLENVSPVTRNYKQTETIKLVLEF